MNETFRIAEVTEHLDVINDLGCAVCAISDALEEDSPERAAVWRLGKLILDHNNEVQKELGVAKTE
jgi:hypothetical protein